MLVLGPVAGEERIICVPPTSLSSGAWYDARRCLVKSYDDFSGLYIVEVEGQRVFVEPGWLVDPDPITIPAPAPKPEVDDWRAWAEDKPGFCPCGIKREMCDYHRY